MPNHIVEQGECLSSIAAQYRYDWDYLWSLSENADLKRNRKNPNILLPGDVVFVPDLTQREEQRGTDQKHNFVLKNLPVKLHLRLLNAGTPIANEKYRIEIEGQVIEGTTDSNGALKEVIPPTAEQARLVLVKEQKEVMLDVGHLDPLMTVSGVQARLNNLGYDCGKVDGIQGPLTASALSSFQETYKLKITGKADSQTTNKLKDLYGS